MYRAGSLFLPALSVVVLIPTFLLYIYPVILGCSFPTPSSNQPAPFRLLVLADPQLEGDSSLPKVNDPSVFVPFNDALPRYRKFMHGNSAFVFRLLRKKLDLLGNDYYLAHIYRTLFYRLRPTHVTVLGDLLGSQWVSDEEFGKRTERYWDRVLGGGKRVEDAITSGLTISTLGQDHEWKRRIINVAGNHDIGYAGDIDRERMERFESAFGKANYDVRFTLPQESPKHDPPELRLLVLNSLNLDGPTLDPEIQSTTYDFINKAIGASRLVEDTTSATILLTHLPLHKEEGICVDGPMIRYYEDERNNGVKEQNHLSIDSTRNILQGIFGKSGDANAPMAGHGRNGIILTGHDHEGCDVWHHLPPAIDGEEQRQWQAQRWNETSVNSRAEDGPGIREITVRSMMGEFGGNAGLLSAWFEEETRSWRIEYQSCPLGKQHWWWAVHIADAVVLWMWGWQGFKRAMRRRVVIIEREREKERIKEERKRE